jgi:hypothetical protein
MKPLHTVASATAFLSFVLVATSPAHAELDATSTARLAALSATPTLSGELIYRGSTFAQKGAGPEPLFRYERRVVTTPTALEATHLTRDPAQKLVIAESAQFNSAYQLQRFTVQNQQLGYSGVVQVSSDGRQLQYSLNNNGVQSTANETIDLPAVSGPSLFGFILAHRSELGAGKTVPVRFIVLQEKQTYGFDIRQESQAKGQAVFSITPSSWLLRPFFATMRVTVDTNSKTLVRYEGRVPPKQIESGKLADLDARVDYTTVAVSYR